MVALSGILGKLMVAGGLLALTSALEQGQIIGGPAASPAAAPAEAPTCIQSGIKASFYEVTAGQAQYLAQQFPFIEGEGALVDTLSVTEMKMVPQINFAPANLKRIDRLADPLTAWPHTSPPNYNGSVAIFESSLNINFSGYWSFFVASSSPVELVLSQNGNGLEATKSSSELELDDSQNILGQVYLIQYNLDVGVYDLRLEWQQMVVSGTAPKELLVLEWAWIADEDKVPSPSPPQFPRAIIPSSAFRTICKDGAVPTYETVSGAPAPDSSYPEVPDAAPQQAAPFDQAYAAPAVEASQAEAPPAESPAPEEDSAASPTPSSSTFNRCKAIYENMGPWMQGTGYEKVINFSLTSLGGIVEVPYDIVVSGSKFENIEQPYNWELGTPAGGGVFPGKVTASWATLNTINPVNLGALFQSQVHNFALEGVSINGVKCSLFPKE